jgi:hypothetical protein
MNVTWVAVAALIVSFVSLLYSLYTGHVTRRALQFQKLAELRTKLTRLRWKMVYRLSDLKQCIDALEKAMPSEAEAWNKHIADLERILETNNRYEVSIADLYRMLERIPLILSPGHLESLHHYVDGITESVDVSRAEVVKKLQDAVEELKELRGEAERLMGS